MTHRNAVYEFENADENLATVYIERRAGRGVIGTTDNSALVIRQRSTGGAGVALDVGGALRHADGDVGFFGATPVPQAAAIADVAEGITASAEEIAAAFNDTLAALRALGLIAE